MSWQAYVDTQLVATGHVCQAAILSAADASVWASTPDFGPRSYEGTVRLEDGQGKAELVNEAANLVEFMATGVKPRQGLRLNGEEYNIFRVTDDPLVVYARKPKGGMTLYRASTCIVVGTYSEDLGQSARGCNLAVDALGHFLLSSGY